MKTEITQLKIRIGNREIELTPDEARQVHDELAKLFAPPPPVVSPIIIQQPLPWSQPWWQSPITCEPPSPWQITWGGTGAPVLCASLPTT